MTESSDWVPALLQLANNAVPNRQTPALRLRIQQLLPGGFPHSYFDPFPEFTPLKSSRRALRQSVTEGILDALGRAATDYVALFEECLLRCCPPDGGRQRDEYQRAFEQALLALAVLRPVDVLSRPIFCLISGPSGSGKDTVLKRTIEWLQARGYPARYLTKYVDRSPRDSEAGGHPLFRYQVHVGRRTEQASKIPGAPLGEIPDSFFEYQRYGNWYAFSRADVEAFAAAGNPPVVFIVMSEYARLREFWSEIQSIVERLSTNFDKISFLLEATEDRSLESLVSRVLSRTKNDPTALDDAYEDYRVRRAEITSDYAQIAADSAMFAEYVDIRNLKPDNGLSATGQIYQRLLNELSK